MFSLIITIISIALVAALALATIYYGGDAFTRGGDAAAAAQLINEGQQLNGASTLARVDNVTVATVADLVTGQYLAQAPQGWALAAGQFTVSAERAEVCDEINADAGIAADVLVLPAANVFGCIVDDVTTPTTFTMVYND